MKKLFYQSLKMLLLMTVLFGALYPLAVLALAQGAFPWRANGSLIYRNGVPLGSELLGQSFSGPRYFHGRPSTAGRDGYDAANSSGSNLGPTNSQLIQNISERAAKVRSENGLVRSVTVPSDLVTASASGLDPHISPDAALMQVERVARTRNLPPDTVRSLVEKHIEGRQPGILGEPRVNVLKLNLGLEELEKTIRRRRYASESR